MIQAKVQYRAIAGFEDYRVGDDGSVWSRLIKGSKFGRTGPWKPIKPVIHDTYARLKYHRVSLSRKGVITRFYVHRLVLEAFVGPCPEGMECCHGDGDPFNNRLDDLRWDTHESNIRDTMSMGRVPKGSAHHSALRKLNAAS